jgi:hypothetical protein
LCVGAVGDLRLDVLELEHGLHVDQRLTDLHTRTAFKAKSPKVQTMSWQAPYRRSSRCSFITQRQHSPVSETMRHHIYDLQGPKTQGSMSAAKPSCAHALIVLA